jgi:hypothetical protein
MDLNAKTENKNQFCIFSLSNARRFEIRPKWKTMQTCCHCKLQMQCEGEGIADKQEGNVAISKETRRIDTFFLNGSVTRQTFLREHRS